MTAKIRPTLDESQVGYILLYSDCPPAGRLHGQSTDYDVTLFDPQEEDSPICRTRALPGR